MALFWFSRRQSKEMFRPLRNLVKCMHEAQGVPQDFVQAYMWFHLAATNGEEPSAEKREILAMKMTSDQITEAQKLAREWKPTRKSVAWKPLDASQRILSSFNPLAKHGN